MGLTTGTPQSLAGLDSLVKHSIWSDKLSVEDIDDVVVEESVWLEVEHREGVLPVLGILADIALFVGTQTAQRLAYQGLILSESYLGVLLDVMDVTIEDVDSE